MKSTLPSRRNMFSPPLSAVDTRIALRRVTDPVERIARGGDIDGAVIALLLVLRSNAYMPAAVRVTPRGEDEHKIQGLGRVRIICSDSASYFVEVSGPC